MEKWNSIILPISFIGIVSMTYYYAKIKTNHPLENKEENKVETISEVKNGSKKSTNTSSTSTSTSNIIIMYGSCTGTAKMFAEILKNHLLQTMDSNNSNITIKNTSDFDDSDLEHGGILLLLCSTWEDGQPPESAKRLYHWLYDYVNDFRVSKDHLQSLSYSVFGLGGKVYGSRFCKVVKLIQFNSVIL
jgi:sulfite reductase alpha subunit-like flavoprotein